MITKKQYSEAKEIIGKYLDENNAESGTLLAYISLSVFDVIADYNGDDITAECAMGYAGDIVSRFLHG